MAFAKAVKHKLKLRAAFQGPSGSGKTYSALSVGRALVGQEGRIAVIDTERGSARKYADDFDFDVVEPESFAPESLVQLIKEAEAEGYDLAIVDSSSHYWMGQDGILDQVDKASKRSDSKNNFSAWKDVAPKEKAVWAALLSAKMHIIVTLRTKTEYVIEEQVRNGRKINVPRKVGTAPIQRDGTEYEFDVVMDLDLDNNGVITKTRCSKLAGEVFTKPGDAMAGILRTWLDGGTDVAPVAAEAKQPEPAADDAELRSDLLKTVGELTKELGIPNPVTKSLINLRGYQSSKQMPTAELEQFAKDLDKVFTRTLSGDLDRAAVLDALQTTGECDPLKALANG